MTKKERGRGLREALSTLWFNLRLAARLHPLLLAGQVVQALLRAGLPLIAVLLPKLVIGELEAGGDGQRLLTYVLVAAGAGAVLYGLSELLKLWTDREGAVLDLRFDKAVADKLTDMDYAHLEDPETLTLLQKGKQGRMTQGGIQGLIGWTLPGLLRALFTGAAMLWVIVSLNVWVFIAIAACVGVSLYLQMKANDAQNTFMLQMGDLNRLFNYYYGLAQDYSNGKDIRLFGAEPLISARIRESNQKGLANEQTCYRTICRCQMGQAFLSQAQVGVIYLSLIVQALTQGLSIASFVSLAAGAVVFTQQTLAFFNALMQILTGARLMTPYKDFLQLKDEMAREGEETAKADTLVFEDVSFTYPRAKEPTLRHLNLTLKKGERLAVVGENGAGKTTMIKLLLRLYDPDEGRILLGGRDIRELSLEAYRALFSVVFQDFQLFAFSVKENLTLGKAEAERLEAVLHKAGLTEVIEKLPKGVETSVYKSFDEEGVEFSGGERQKLAIARALYRGAPLVVMDEPTAALDPVAEEEIYAHMNALIEGRTALFISHRLSSCRFCDRVAVFAGGAVVQEGAHDALVNREGLYKRMWDAQAGAYVSQA